MPKILLRIIAVVLVSALTANAADTDATGNAQRAKRNGVPIANCAMRMASFSFDSAALASPLLFEEGTQAVHQTAAVNRQAGDMALGSALQDRGLRQALEIEPKSAIRLIKSFGNTFWKSSREYAWSQRDESAFALINTGLADDVLGSFGALVCNYVILWDRRALKGALIHTLNPGFPGFALDVLYNTAKILGANLEYRKKNVEALILRPTQDFAVSLETERMNLQALRDMDIPTLQSRVSEAWAGEIRFAVREGLVAAIDTPSRKIVRALQFPPAAHDPTANAEPSDFSPGFKQRPLDNPDRLKRSGDPQLSNTPAASKKRSKTSIQTQSWTNPYEWMTRAPWDEVEPHLRTSGMSTYALMVRQMGGASSNIEFLFKVAIATSYQADHLRSLGFAIHHLSKSWNFDYRYFGGEFPMSGAPLRALEDFQRIYRFNLATGHRPLTLSRYLKLTPGTDPEQAALRIEEWKNMGIAHWLRYGVVATAKGVGLGELYRFWKDTRDNSLPRQKSATPWHPPHVPVKSESNTPSTMSAVSAPDFSDEKAIANAMMELKNRLSRTTRAMVNALLKVSPTLASTRNAIRMCLFYGKGHLRSEDIPVLKNAIASGRFASRLGYALEANYAEGAQSLLEARERQKQIVWKIPRRFVGQVLARAGRQATVQQLVFYAYAQRQLDPSYHASDGWLFPGGKLAAKYGVGKLSPKGIQPVEMSTVLEPDAEYAFINLTKADPAASNSPLPDKKRFMSITPESPGDDDEQERLTNILKSREHTAGTPAAVSVPGSVAKQFRHQTMVRWMSWKDIRGIGQKYGTKRALSPFPSFSMDSWYEEVVSLFNQLPSPPHPKTILAIGAGAEALMKLLKDFPTAETLYVIDAHPALFAELEAALEKNPPKQSHATILSYRQNALELPEEIDHVDLIYHGNVFDPQYFSKDQMRQAASEIERVLSPGGYVMVTASSLYLTPFYRPAMKVIDEDRRHLFHLLQKLPPAPPATIRRRTDHDLSSMELHETYKVLTTIAHQIRTSAASRPQSKFLIQVLHMPSLIEPFGFLDQDLCIVLGVSLMREALGADPILQRDFGRLRHLKQEQDVAMGMLHSLVALDLLSKEPVLVVSHVQRHGNNYWTLSPQAQRKIKRWKRDAFLYLENIADGLNMDILSVSEHYLLDLPLIQYKIRGRPGLKDAIHQLRARPSNQYVDEKRETLLWPNDIVHTSFWVKHPKATRLEMSSRRAG